MRVLVVREIQGSCHMNYFQHKQESADVLSFSEIRNSYPFVSIAQLVYRKKEGDYVVIPADSHLSEILSDPELVSSIIQIKGLSNFSTETVIKFVHLMFTENLDPITAIKLTQTGDMK